MDDNQHQVPQTNDPEAAAKAAWLASNSAEVAPQVEADPHGVAATGEAGMHTHHIDFVGDVTHYRAIISAHFPDEETAGRVAEQINGTELPERSYLQVYREGDEHVETELAKGEVIIILQLGEGESDHEALVRMITEGGGTKVNYTPPQALINAGFEEH